MARHGLKTLAVLLAVVAAACDRPTNPVAPTAAAPVSPRLSFTSGSYYIGGWRLLQGSRVAMLSRLDVIDATGGKLSLGGSSLAVPAGAVSGPTLFVFTLQTDPYISAKLVAMSMSGFNMGKLVTTFARPLTLTLSYADATPNVGDAASARVLWMENDVLLGVQPTTVDPLGKSMTAQLTHFTQYTPGVPGPEACDPGSLETCEQP